jgi:hypothetical protein
MLSTASFVALLVVSATAAVYAQASDGSSASASAASALVSVPVKVIEGVDGAGVVGSGTNDAGLDPSQAHPDAMHGPEALFPLFGLCFCESADRMEYCVCPFRNVTMRRFTGGKATLLGVFGSWLDNRSPAHPSSDHAAATGTGNLVMEFFRGQSCGQGARRASVEIVPDAAEYALDAASIEENPACHTQMRLLVPLPRELLTDPSLFLARPDLASTPPPLTTTTTTATTASASAVESPGRGAAGSASHASGGVQASAASASTSSLDREKLAALEIKVYMRMNYILRLYACL